MARWFNTAGPCNPNNHYMIPASARLPTVPGLVARNGYFVVHAPRQTGKTTTLRALAAELTDSGRYAALLTSCEPGRAWGDDVGEATRAILQKLRDDAEDALPPELVPPPWPEAADGALLGTSLRAWSRACPRPVVLFLDEIDALEGRTLISALGQLRSGATNRPSRFPASIALCGLRDLRDYKIASGGNPNRLGGPSPFNIIVESLRLGNFTLDEVWELYGQHTTATGQKFTTTAVNRAFELTGGQPWLVNALADEIVRKLEVPPSAQITAAHVDKAKERLVLARATHLDSLVDKLNDPRVRAIIEPMLAGTVPVEDPLDDDLQYVRDLGLIAVDAPVRISNPIYSEVVVRVLTDRVLQFTPDAPPPRAFVLPDGRMDFARLLAEFAEFWKANGDILVSRQVYHEAAPHLVLQAYLQRVINGGGTVLREYGVGRGRLDLLVRWPHPTLGNPQAEQRQAIEIKARAAGDPDPIAQGLLQLDGYLDRLDLDTGTLALFDRRPTAPAIHDRTSISPTTSPAGRTITLFRG
ncbi:ATP-binding protein [Frankia sp. AgB1.9]|uniref:ATP-binding protein n=1 Tax=unclassified Frankia TaxID=2632575 RepID=UPI001932CDFB|nr:MULTISPECIES: ATP-binding protein [unclassified Frankia]MBL7486613.1 ATP-binding protein [Frankia sp. AgW1.1]MBL7552889.1 ATP-binding protein [Frankia sp. AgB1.9]MBL7621084.1 ATP-binding protein [Frankia sp. AgB1.8]